MKIHFRCPECSIEESVEPEAGTDQLACAACGSILRLTEPVPADDRLRRCLVCPGRELFTRKDFPQRVGVAIVVAGFLLSSWAWYYHLVMWTFAILFLTALADVVLFLLVGDVVECYNCHAIYRGWKGSVDWQPFELEVHEKYRQKKARTAART